MVTLQAGGFGPCPPAVRILRPGEPRMIEQDRVDHDTAFTQERPQGEAYAEAVHRHEVAGVDGSRFGQGRGGVEDDPVEPQSLPGRQRRLFQADGYMKRLAQGLPYPLLRALGLDIKIGGEQQDAKGNRRRHRCAHREPAQFSHVETN